MRQSSSSIQAYKSCRRLYQLKYIYGVEPVSKAEALERGINYHQKIEQLLTGKDFDRDNDKTTAMADAFAKYLLPKIDAVAQEEWFTMNFADGESIIGRIDARTPDGALIEHKTMSGEIDEAYWYSKQYDEQLMTYMLAYGTNRAIYTVCKTPTIRLKKGETEEERRLENEKLPAIVVGTEKQIAWAIKIRLGLKKQFDIMRKDVEEEYLEKFDQYVDFVLAKDDATFWINNRDDADYMSWIASEKNVFKKIAHEFFD